MSDTNKQTSENSIDCKSEDNESSAVENVCSKSASQQTQPNEKSCEEDTNDDVQLDLSALELSGDTMKALQEFLVEQRERDDKLKMIQEGNVPDTFEENWNLSQFWYSMETADALAEECLRVAQGGAIACISSPTLYRALTKREHTCTVNVFEFDARFAVFKENFILYDYRNPLGIPRDLREAYDVIVADPPYLREDCLTKVALTIKFVAKPNARIILCTGKVMVKLAKSLMDLNIQNFEIIHDKERLSNPFGCFANYNLDEHCKYKRV